MVAELLHAYGWFVCGVYGAFCSANAGTERLAILYNDGASFGRDHTFQYEEDEILRSVWGFCACPMGNSKILSQMRCQASELINPPAKWS